jgi:uncharacterized Zn-binding protein involved in type VI secretion
VNDANYQGSASGQLVIGKGTAVVTLGGLAATYDATPKAATATTSPAGLAVNFTYEGSAQAPTAVGSYAVVATVNDPSYEGSASGELVISKASATVMLNGLVAMYDGTPKAVTATTSPAGLEVSLTYDGSAQAPTAVGSYAVVATVNDANFQGSASGQLVIGKGAAVVTLGGLAATYDGAPKPVTATTSPAGLAVSFTYEGATEAPIEAGSYQVVATVDDPNYHGSATGMLVIAAPGYDEWLGGYFVDGEMTNGGADPEGDPDGDGWSNLAEYALGTHPGDSGESPKLVLDKERVTLTFTRPKGRTDVLYEAESSDTMAADDWWPVPLEVVGESPESETVRTRPVPAGQQPKRMFLRLKFSLIDPVDD